MIRIFAISLIGATLSLLALEPAAAAGPSTHPKASASEWEVPDPDTTGMQPAVVRLIREARGALRTRPTSPEAWGHLAAVCYAHNEYDCAEVAYRHATELAPDRFRWIYLLAIVRQHQGADPDEVIALLQRAVDRAPDYPPAQYRLGYALALRGQMAESSEVFLRVLELRPDYALAHRGLGDVLLALGDLPRAVIHLERAARLAPKEGAVVSSLARAYARMGQKDRARETAERAQTLKKSHAIRDPVHSEVLALAVNLAACEQRAERHLDAGEYVQAIPDLKIILELQPDDPDIHAALGQAYRKSGRPELAITHFTKALTLKDDMAIAHFALASVFLDQGRLDDAIGHLRKTRTHAPEHTRARVLLGEALRRQGDIDEAIAEFEQAAKLGELGAQAHFYWGKALASRGDVEQAADHYKKATQLSPDHADAHFSLGFLLERLGKMEEALAHYRRAAEIDPTHRAARRLRRLRARGRQP